MRFFVKVGFLRHPKLLRLATKLRLRPLYAASHLVALWEWTMDYREAGSLSGLSSLEVASAAQWKGDPDKFVNAMVEIGFLDLTDNGLEVHRWLHHQGRLTQERARDRERKRAKNSLGNSTGNSLGNSTGTPPAPFLSLSHPYPSPSHPLPGNGDASQKDEEETTTEDDAQFQPGNLSALLRGVGTEACDRCQDGYLPAEKRCCDCDRGRSRAKALAQSRDALKAHEERKQPIPITQLAAELSAALPGLGSRSDNVQRFETMPEAEARSLVAALAAKDPTIARLAETRSAREVLRLCHSRLNGLLSGEN